MRTRYSLVVWCVTLLGCASAVAPGIEAYEQARYPEAARLFAPLASAELAPDERARYQLYDGLNHLALGNLNSAVRSLTLARAALERDARLLSPEDQARLFAAWRALGRSPGRPLEPTPVGAPPRASIGLP